VFKFWYRGCYTIESARLYQWI